MKIICFTRYSSKGASSRYRFYNLKKYFKKNNLEFIVKPLLNDNYLEDLYKNRKKNFFNIFFCYLKRFFILFSILKYNRIIIEKELFPYIPYFEYALFKIFKSKIFLDYDDFIFNNYLFKVSILNRLFKNKFRFILENCNGVITGNNFLKTYVLDYNKNSIVIPTLINIDSMASSVLKILSDEEGFRRCRSSTLERAKTFRIDSVLPKYVNIDKEIKIKCRAVLLCIVQKSCCLFVCYIPRNT